MKPTHECRPCPAMANTVLIVGSGPSGCACAAALLDASKDPTLRVLVVERGPELAADATARWGFPSSLMEERAYAACGYAPFAGCAWAGTVAALGGGSALNAGALIEDETYWATVGRVRGAVAPAAWRGAPRRLARLGVDERRRGPAGTSSSACGPPSRRRLPAAARVRPPGPAAAPGLPADARLRVVPASAPDPDGGRARDRRAAADGARLEPAPSSSRRPERPSGVAAVAARRRRRRQGISDHPSWPCRCSAAARRARGGGGRRGPRAAAPPGRGGAARRRRRRRRRRRPRSRCGRGAGGGARGAGRLRGRGLGRAAHVPAQLPREPERRVRRGFYGARARVARARLRAARRAHGRGARVSADDGGPPPDPGLDRRPRTGERGRSRRDGRGAGDAARWTAGRRRRCTRRAGRCWWTGCGPTVTEALLKARDPPAGPGRADSRPRRTGSSRSAAPRRGWTGRTRKPLFVVAAVRCGTPPAGHAAATRSTWSRSNSAAARAFVLSARRRCLRSRGSTRRCPATRWAGASGSSSPPNKIVLLLKFTVADRRPGPPPTGGGGARASPRSRCRRGSRPAPARMSGAAPRSGPTRRWARGRASRGVQRYIPSRPAGRRRSSLSAAARTGRAVMSCVEIKFRAPRHRRDVVSVAASARWRFQTIDDVVAYPHSLISTQVMSPGATP